MAEATKKTAVEKPAAAADAAEVKKEEAKIEAEAPKAETKKPAAKKTTKKESAKKDSTKKEATKKTAKKAADETTAAKPRTRKAAVAEVSAEVVVQHAENDYTTERLVSIAKDRWQYDHHRDPADFKSVKFYVKLEDKLVYYVINDEVSDSFPV